VNHGVLCVFVANGFHGGLMRITVKVKPNARTNSVEQLDENTFVVRVSAPPTEGKANERVLEVLAEHFHVPKRSVTILRGGRSKAKIIEIQP
jgi:uncharacterized protein (TIGR00251 family)